jgi:hypothetical protein
MNGTPEVLHDPPPEALLGAVGNGTVDIELRFWSGARQLETREALRAFKAQSVRDGFRRLRHRARETPRGVAPAADRPEGRELVVPGHGRHRVKCCPRP